MKIRSMYISAAIVLAVILIGQIMIYTIDPYRTEADSHIEDGHIVYNISSNTSSSYDAILFESDVLMPDTVLIYEDPRYASYFEADFVRSKITYLCSELSVRNVKHEIVDADEMKDKLEGDLTNDKASFRLFIPVGIMPDTVYSGNPDDCIFRWLKMGGVLYWTGYQIGRSISSFDGIFERNGGYGDDFLGIPDEDIRVDTHSLYATETARDHDLGRSLSVVYNDSTFGINNQNLTDYVSIGLTANGYDSLILTKYHDGEGMIVVFGGKLDTNTIPMMSQIIASKLAYDSEISEHRTGTINKSSVTGVIDILLSKTYTLYIYVGVPQIYAKTFDY